MMVEITGKVLKIGKIKDYGHDTNWGRTWVPLYKFFTEIESKDHGIINAMVECNAQETNYGYQIPKDETRQRPFIGDIVKITTHRLRKNGATWASVTFNQTFEIIAKNQEARKEREAFIAQKKQEREQAYQKKVEERKKQAEERKQARLDELEVQKNDERLPEAVRKEITKTFDINKIISILQDTTWFTMEEGEGGKRCLHYPPDGCGCPGTGMRRPGGALYNTPATARKSILSKALKSGLIIETEKGYKATDLGIKLLVKLDTCPVCNALRRPWRATGHYSTPWFSRHDDLGIRYHCTHEIQETLKQQHGSNCGTTYRGLKSTEKRLQEMLLVSGAAITSAPIEPVYPRVIHKNGKRIIMVTKEEYDIIKTEKKEYVTPEVHKNKCNSTKPRLPTVLRGGSICPDCKRFVLGGGIGSGQPIENTKYEIIQEE